MNSALLRSSAPAVSPPSSRGQGGTTSGAGAAAGAGAFASIMQGTLDARDGVASRGARYEPATNAAPDRSADRPVERPVERPMERLVERTPNRTANPASPAQRPQPDASKPDAGKPDAGKPDAGKPDAGKPIHRGRADAAAAPMSSTIAPASFGTLAPVSAPLPVAAGTQAPSDEAGSPDTPDDSALVVTATVPAMPATAAGLDLSAQSRPAGTMSDGTASNNAGSDNAGSDNAESDKAEVVGACAATPVGDAGASAAVAAAAVPASASVAVAGAVPALRTAAEPTSTAAATESAETAGVDAAAGSTAARTIDATATGVGTAAPGTSAGAPTGPAAQNGSPAPTGMATGTTALSGLVPVSTAADFGAAVAAAARIDTEAAAPVDKAAAPGTVAVPAGSVVTPAPNATPAAAAAAPAPAAAVPTVPLAAQVARPLFNLAGAVNGDHVLTISVSPDNLGPVTVRAHVNGDNIRVELFAPTDLARDALRAILPDLRRDLSGGGLPAHLDLSANDSPSDPSANRQDRQQPDARTERGRGAGEAAPERFRAPVFGSTHTIDILA